VRGPVEQNIGKKQHQISSDIKVREKNWEKICTEEGWTGKIFVF
jgi:hypothetical protein